jgi:hypothetical protein
VHAVEILWRGWLRGGWDKGLARLIGSSTTQIAAHAIKIRAEGKGGRWCWWWRIRILVISTQGKLYMSVHYTSQILGQCIVYSRETGGHTPAPSFNYSLSIH